MLRSYKSSGPWINRCDLRSLRLKRFRFPGRIRVLLRVVMPAGPIRTVVVTRVQRRHQCALTVRTWIRRTLKTLACECSETAVSPCNVIWFDCRHDASIQSSGLVIRVGTRSVNRSTLALDLETTSAVYLDWWVGLGKNLPHEQKSERKLIIRHRKERLLSWIWIQSLTFELCNWVRITCISVTLWNSFYDRRSLKIRTKLFILVFRPFRTEVPLRSDHLWSKGDLELMLRSTKREADFAVVVARNRSPEEKYFSSDHFP